MKINIVGWYGKKNVGDEAFGVVFDKYLSRHQLTFVTPPNVVNSGDITILGGGNVVAPFYLKSLDLKQPLYALGVGIGYESEINLLAQYPFKDVYVRNGTDIEAMKKLGIPAKSIPDLAFLLKPRSSTKVLQRFAWGRRKVLGVLVTDYVNPAIDRPVSSFALRGWDFVQKIAKYLDAMHKKGWDIVLIPCSTGGYGNDKRINLDLCAFMETPPTVIEKSLSPNDMIDLISQLDMTLCMRFHAHVFSMIAGTPFVSIGFTRKVNLFLQENGLEEMFGGCFSGDVFDDSKLMDTTETVLANSYWERFSTKTAENRAILEQTMQTVLQSWTGE